MLSSMLLLEDLDDLVDVRGGAEQWLSWLRPCTAGELVDRFERAVAQFAALELEAAYALNVPAAVAAAQVHADATRRVADAQASVARAVLKS